MSKAAKHLELTLIVLDKSIELEKFLAEKHFSSLTKEGKDYVQPNHLSGASEVVD